MEFYKLIKTKNSNNYCLNVITKERNFFGHYKKEYGTIILKIQQGKHYIFGNDVIYGKTLRGFEVCFNSDNLMLIENKYTIFFKKLILKFYNIINKVE